MTTTTLDNVCELIVDCLHNTAPIQESGFPLIRTPNIGKGRFLLDDVYRISEETYSIWTQRAIPEPGDLILAREAPAGNVAIVKEGEKVCLGQRTVHLRPNRKIVDPDFLCYFLLAPAQQGKLLAGETGATAKHVNMKDIRRLELSNLPNLEAQKAAGNILSTYDDLIENNRRRMALLEDAARQVYQEWFVRLRFPGREHTRIVDSVPEGWEKCCVKDLGRVITGKTPSTTDSSNHGGEIPFIKTPDMHGNAYVTETESFLTDKGAESQSGKFVPSNTILVSCIGAKLGAVSLTSCRAQFNQQINAVIPSNEVHTFFCYFACTDMKPTLEALGGGATMPNVNKSKFENLTFLLP